MMRNPGVIFSLLIFCLSAFTVQAQKGFSLVDAPAHKKVEVRYDGKLLTAYCYFDSTEKPVLFPIKTVSGVTVTRGYPIAPRPGERTDHPHHVGLWLNYESVNGLDFWNNSDAISPEKKPHYGSIKHQKILSSESKKDKASLKTLSNWVDQAGNILLEETTYFVFTKKGNDFIIDRVSTLEAKMDEVVFKDVKDGMIAIRVARQLELPSKESGKYVDAHGEVTTVPPSGSDVTGMYINEEGIRGDDVWSTRSRWAVLNGTKDGETISIAIIDHPKNPGYPTYWHARGYGLFAANPLGQQVFSKGKEELNLVLKEGQKAAFRYRIIVHSGSTLQNTEINQQAADFAKTNY
ncbi:MAG: PmoA family protein [Cyclobacteriaceae bacterium]|nr:PmoA family protein [Cyclobacteriaceae bacterium]MDH4296697.1 PmoA family protein [Cyclobacteriaceae bacterium]